MAYTHNWTHQDANGHVLVGDRIYAVDSTEIRDAADRRLKVMFNPAGKWPIASTAAVGAAIDDQNMVKVRDGFLAAVPLWGYFAGESNWWQLYTLRAWLYPSDLRVMSTGGRWLEILPSFTLALLAIRS